MNVNRLWEWDSIIFGLSLYNYTPLVSYVVCYEMRIEMMTLCGSFWEGTFLWVPFCIGVVFSNFGKFRYIKKSWQMGPNGSHALKVQRK